MTQNEALQLLTPADIEWARQLRRESVPTWQARWIAGVPHRLDDPQAVADALETMLAA
jgi:hypothetical protein